MPSEPLSPDGVRALCRHWLPGRPVRSVDLGGGGFSGSPVWRVDTLDASGAVAASYVLKGFAAGWSRARAEAIHRFAAALRAAGIDAIPRQLALVAAGGGSVFEEPTGSLWELSEWRCGRPVESPTSEQARAGLAMLARIHSAAAGIVGDGGLPPPSRDEAGRSGVPAWERRRRRLLAVAGHGWETPAGRGTRSEAGVAVWRRKAAQTLSRHGGRTLVARLAALPVPAVDLQPVLRDVWHAHVLFEGARVEGVIDLHAAGIDTPATDLARLLGSWKHPPRLGRVSDGDRAAGTVPWLTAGWGDALAAYDAIRPLSPEEIRLVDLLHVGGVVGGLDHWFESIPGDGRIWRPPPAVEIRIDALLENLDSALRAADSLLQATG